MAVTCKDQIFFLHPSPCVTSFHSPPALFSEPVLSSLSLLSGPDGWGHEVASDPRPRALSVMAVRPELDTLYKEMNEQNRGEGPKRVCHVWENTQNMSEITIPLFTPSLPFCACVCMPTGYAAPHDKVLFTLSPGAHNQHDLSSYRQLSHHAFQPYQLGGIPEGHLMKSDSGLVKGGPLWDMENLVGNYSGSSAHQPGSSQAGETLHKCYTCSDSF